MTNRDPNRPDFFRKFEDLYQCYQNYFTLPDEGKRLPRDLNKQDIDLVCYYEINQLQKHLKANPWGVHYNDFVKSSPSEEKEIFNHLKNAYR